jgi:hypothetical protein
MAGDYVQFTTWCLAAAGPPVVAIEPVSSVRVTLLAVRGYVSYLVAVGDRPPPRPIEDLTGHGSLSLGLLAEGEETTLHFKRTASSLGYSLQVASGSKVRDAIVSIIAETT